MKEDRLLKSPEASEVLGTTTRTLETWRCQGKGPTYVKIGRSVRYKMSDLQEYINSLQGGLQ